MLASQDDEAEDEGETTLYFDAQEGTFVNEDGEEITVDVEEEAFGNDDPAGAFPPGGVGSGQGGQTEVDKDEVLQMTEEAHDAHGATPAPSDE